MVLLLTVSGALAGALASVVGFGIGSLLTPAFAIELDTKLAVATTAGVVMGTAAGAPLLHALPELWFRRAVAVTLTVLGLVMLTRALS
jgi:uncharacterized membrane protein YfcA